jgi:hypothetical protein
MKIIQKEMDTLSEISLEEWILGWTMPVAWRTAENRKPFHFSYISINPKRWCTGYLTIPK